MKTTMTFY
jgi:threonine aldolase